MTVEEIITALAALEAERARLLLALLRPAPQVEDRLLTIEEAAAILSTTPDWLYRHADDLPFTVRLAPGQLRFSSRRVQEYLRA
jgi:predicted DNA-binding transcriptional regulator AlpA